MLNRLSWAAVIVLPSYLDRLEAGHEDLPILLLPTLNELRATYDESLMSEGTLFAPDLDVIIPELSGSEADTVADNDVVEQTNAQQLTPLLQALTDFDILSAGGGNT